MKRIQSLDGLRGLAVLMVVLYHAFSIRWPQLNNPNILTDFFFFKYGYLGVQLFFLISGYVIYMSLERSHSLGSFAYRRWLRLFPAMLVATLLMFISWPILSPDRSASTPTLLNALPGLLFIEESWLSKILGTNIYRMDAVFWTLFVEVKFYAIFGMLYFTMRRYAVYVLTTLFLFSFALKTLAFVHVSFPGDETMKMVSDQLSLKYFGWFSAGAFLYLYFKYDSKRMLGASLSVALLSCTMLGASNHKDIMVGGLIVATIFYAGMLIPFFARAIGNRFMVFMGFISYPLYLIHDSATAAIGLKFNKAWPGTTLIGLVLATVLMVLLAWIMAKYVEPMLRKWLSIERKPQPNSISRSEAA